MKNHQGNDETLKVFVCGMICGAALMLPAILSAFIK